MEEVEEIPDEIEEGAEGGEEGEVEDDKEVTKKQIEDSIHFAVAKICEGEGLGRFLIYL